MKENFNETIAKLMQKYNIPGLSMAIINDSKISYINSMGTKDYKTQLPVDHKTLFGIGSVSKSFTSLAILKLFEESKLSLNDPINKFLPIRQDQKDEPITINHLMTHSSGIPDLGVLSLLLDIQCNRVSENPIIPLASQEDLILHINEGLKEGTVPGEHYFYFNSGYTLLGLIIEKITEMKFEEYVEKNILIPLGMHRSTYSSDKFYADTNYSKGYIIDKKDGKVSLREEKPVFHPFFSAPGGLMTSVEELSHYLIMHMRGGKYEGIRVINTDILQLAHSSQFKGESIGIQSIDTGQGAYGFGWRVHDSFFGNRYVSHGGSVGVYSSHLGFFPALDIGVIIMANVKEIPAEIMMRFIAFALGKPVNSLNGLIRYHYLQVLCGDYMAFKGTNRASIKLRGGLLELSIPRWQINVILVPHNRFDLYPERFVVYNAFGGMINVYFNKTKLDGTKRINFLYERNQFNKCNQGYYGPK